MAKWFRRGHAVATVAWAIMMPVAITTGWIYSVAFISVISLYANFVGHFGSWQATRVEVNQEEE